MKKKLLILYRRLREQLWFRPFLFCLLSVVGALLASKVDGTRLDDLVPAINRESIEHLLDTLSASMLVISVFAVASMISAFSAASNTATPRSFKIVVTDDVSQNALSVFIGTFIFSIVGTVALNNDYYGTSGRFVVFVITICLFGLVILTFLRWVNRISRLGRLEHTITHIEHVAHRSLSAFIQHPHLKACPLEKHWTTGQLVQANSVGYVQHLNLESLQKWAEEKELHVQLLCLPGKFIHPNSPLARVRTEKEIDQEELTNKVQEAVHIGDTRLYDEDPRFGLIALSEIASRALSPGINDPGTAIHIIGSHERLFSLWNKEKEKTENNDVQLDRIEIGTVSMTDLLDDAFRPIARDGAGNIEVMLRLQKALTFIGGIDAPQFKEAAIQSSKDAYQRAEIEMKFNKDLKLLQENSALLDG